MKNNSDIFKNLLCGSFGLVFMGCVATNQISPSLPKTIKFYVGSLNFPVSMSAGFYSKNYRLLDETDYDVIYRFRKEIPLVDEKTGKFVVGDNENMKLDNYLNKLINEYEGDAVVNFKVVKTTNKKGNGVIVIWGDIVKVKGG